MSETETPGPPPTTPPPAPAGDDDNGGDDEDVETPDEPDGDAPAEE